MRSKSSIRKSLGGLRSKITRTDTLPLTRRERLKPPGYCLRYSSICTSCHSSGLRSCFAWRSLKLFWTDRWWVGEVEFWDGITTPLLSSSISGLNCPGRACSTEKREKNSGKNNTGFESRVYLKCWPLMVKMFRKTIVKWVSNEALAFSCILVCYGTGHKLKWLVRWWGIIGLHRNRAVLKSKRHTSSWGHAHHATVKFGSVWLLQPWKQVIRTQNLWSKMSVYKFYSFTISLKIRSSGPRRFFFPRQFLCVVWDPHQLRPVMNSWQGFVAGLSIRYPAARNARFEVHVDCLITAVTFGFWIHYRSSMIVFNTVIVDWWTFMSARNGNMRMKHLHLHQCVDAFKIPLPLARDPILDVKEVFEAGMCSTEPLRQFQRVSNWKNGLPKYGICISWRYATSLSSHCFGKVSAEGESDMIFLASV